MNLSNPNTGASYDNLMGTVMDAEDHPANNLPELMNNSENNPMNPANEVGQSAMKSFSAMGKSKKSKGK